MDELIWCQIILLGQHYLLTMGQFGACLENKMQIRFHTLHVEKAPYDNRVEGPWGNPLTVILATYLLREGCWYDGVIRTSSSFRRCGILLVFWLSVRNPPNTYGPIINNTLQGRQLSQSEKLPLQIYIKSTLIVWLRVHSPSPAS